MAESGAPPRVTQFSDTERRVMTWTVFFFGLTLASFGGVMMWHNPPLAVAYIAACFTTGSTFVGAAVTIVTGVQWPFK